MYQKVAAAVNGCARFLSIPPLTDAPDFAIFCASSNPGGVPKRLNGTDCKSVGKRLPWFESKPHHHLQTTDSCQLFFYLRGLDENPGSTAERSEAEALRQEGSEDRQARAAIQAPPPISKSPAIQPVAGLFSFSSNHFCQSRSGTSGATDTPRSLRSQPPHSVCKAAMKASAWATEASISRTSWSTLACTLTNSSLSPAIARALRLCFMNST